MPRPLLCLLSISLLAGAAVTRQTLEGNSLADISSCPVRFFGENYDLIFVIFTNDSFLMCFGRFDTNDSSANCVSAPPADSERLELEVIMEVEDVVDVLHDVPPLCSIHLFLNTIEYKFHSHGSQATFTMSGFDGSAANLQFMMNEVTISSTNLTSEETSSESFFDISGCRFEGSAYLPRSEADLPDCVSLTCDATAHLHVDRCGPMESCHGNQGCVLDAKCVASGPAVIDVTGSFAAAPDLCSYDLLAIAGVRLVGGFRERRRKDVAFLDSLRLETDDGSIFIKHGGGVLADGAEVTLSATPLSLHGVEMVRVDAGIEARMAPGDYNVTLFFDGDTALIRLEGPDRVVPPLMGLCGNSSSFYESRSDQSADNCDMEYSEEEPAVDCEAVKERCSLLSAEPFASCRHAVDPAPYMEACVETLCRYPMVDRLGCQFMEAYDRVCAIYSADWRDGWRSHVHCPAAPAAFCQDRVCLDHEFCATAVNGHPGCFCRAIFADPYKSAEMFGDPIICEENQASVSLVSCLLEEHGVDHSMLTLNDETCPGLLDQETHMLNFYFNSSHLCGAEVLSNDTHVVYKNTIRTQDNHEEVIVRHEHISLDFSCFYSVPDTSSMFFRLRDNSVVQHVTSGAWNFVLTMKTYTDSDRTQVVDLGTEVQLDQKIWVELKTEGLDGTLVAMVTDSCWATGEPSPDASLRYDMISHGCATSEDLQTEGNGMGTSNFFSFNMFQFSTSSDVYLHCKVTLCVTNGNSCIPSCARRRRRRRSLSSASHKGDPAFISMGWKK